MRKIRTIDCAIYNNPLWYFIYCDKLTLKKVSYFRKLNRMISKLKSVCRKRINSNRGDFAYATLDRFGDFEYLFNFRVFDKGYAFILIGQNEGIVSKLYTNFDELFDDLYKFLSV